MDGYLHANAVLSVFCKKYMNLKSGLPIRPSEMGVLNIITEAEEPQTPAMLAALLSVSKPMITAHIASLEKKGYITKSPSPLDGRAYYILPTEKAEELAGRVKADTRAQLERLKHAMGAEAFDELVRLAGEANRALDCEGE